MLLLAGIYFKIKDFPSFGTKNTAAPGVFNHRANEGIQCFLCHWNISYAFIQTHIKFGDTITVSCCHVCYSNVRGRIRTCWVGGLTFQVLWYFSRSHQSSWLTSLDQQRVIINVLRNHHVHSFSINVIPGSLHWLVYWSLSHCLKPVFRSFWDFGDPV